MSIFDFNRDGEVEQQRAGVWSWRYSGRLI